MITRRKFIQSNMLGIALPLAGSATMAAGASTSKTAASEEKIQDERDY